MDLPVPSVGEVHGLLQDLQKNLECPICLEVLKEPMSTNCGHIFCRFCILKLLTQKKGKTQCPLCNANVTKRSLREDLYLKEIIRGSLETIHAFECDTGLKFSDYLCIPKKVLETVSASSTCKEQLIINSKGYRDRSKYMTKEEKKSTESGDDPILSQYNRNETGYFLRSKRNSSKTMVLEIDKEPRSVSSEDIFQEEDIVSCMDFESPSSSQVDKDYIMNQSQSYIEHPKTSAKNERFLKIVLDDLCIPKKVLETVSASSTCKEQLIINRKGYRDRSKYMTKEEKKSTESGDDPILSQYNRNETGYFLRSKRNSSKTMVLEIDKEPRSVSEDIFQEEDIVSCMDFESPSSSQVDKDYIMNQSQSYIEHPKTSAKNEPFLKIVLDDLCIPKKVLETVSASSTCKEQLIINRKGYRDRSKYMMKEEKKSTESSDDPILSQYNRNETGYFLRSKRNSSKTMVLEIDKEPRSVSEDIFQEEDIVSCMDFESPSSSQVDKDYIMNQSQSYIEHPKTSAKNERFLKIVLDDLCIPKKVLETVSASSTCKEQLIINRKGYRDRSKYMTKEEKKSTESGDDPILSQYNRNETGYFLRSKRNSSKTMVLEIDKEPRSVSEDIFQEEDIVSCMDFESPSSSQVDKDYIMNQSQSHIEHPETSAKNEPSLKIDICGGLEGRKLGSRDDTKTVNENLEIVEGNMPVKQQQDVSFLDSCMEQPGFSYLQDDRSSSFCRMTQVQLADEAMNMSTNEQIDNGEKTLTDQSAGNLSVVCENKECQLQSQTMPDICLSKSSGGGIIQEMNKDSEWFSKIKEIPSSNSLVDDCSEELQDSDSSDSEISQPLRKVFIQKRTAILGFDNFFKRQNVKASNKELVRKREDPVLENSDQTFAAVKISAAEQPEAAFSKIACVEEAVSMLKGDGDKQAQSECHMIPEFNLTDTKNKSSYLNKRSKELIKPLGKLQVLNKSPTLSEETKEELDIKELRKVNQGQTRAKQNRELQLFTKEARRQNELTKRKINVNERELKQSISLSQTIPSSSVTEDDSCVLQKNPKKARSYSDTNMIDKLHLCNVDMAYANHEKFPHVIRAVKDILNTEETAESHNADSQDRSSCLQFHPGKIEQAVSMDEQVMMNQLEKYAVCSEIIQSDGICTDNCKSTETNNRAKGSCELNLETDESEVDTGFMQNIFGCCKRQSFLLCPNPVKELAVDIKYLQGLSLDKGDKGGTREEKCDVSCDENKSTPIQTPTFSTSSFSEHKNEYLQFALKVPFPDCPSTSLQSVTRNEENGCQPESKKTMDEQRPSPGLERKIESPNDCNGSLNVRKNSNSHDTSFNHINKSSSGSAHFQEAKSKDIENKKMELTQSELMQHYLTSVPLLLEFGNAEKKSPVEEKQLNSDTEKAVHVSSTGGFKSVIPQLNLECSAKEHQHFELLSETPDNLLDPPTKNKNLCDNDILAMSAKVVKQTTNGTDLDSKNKCSPTLKSQDFDLTYQKLLQKLPSSEEDSGEDEMLPCFQALINKQSTQPHPVKKKEIPVEVLASKSSSCFKHKKEEICQSQESEFSVNLFSSQSNVSVVSGKACNSKGLIPFSNCKEKLPSLSENNKDISPTDKVSIDDDQLKCGQEEYAHSGSNLGEEMMPYASEVTPLEDSLGQFSQSEILTTQQRDAMQNNLKQLQQKMAIIEAVLDEGSQSIGSEGCSLEREETDFTREQTETRKEMHSALEKSVSPLAHATCCSAKKRKRKSLLLTGRQKMSLVASGIYQSELNLVRKFAKKTNSTWCNKITEQTTHVIMKTDKDLACERTLKYFIGVAAQKWVLSYQWIIHSFEAGRVLKEEDFEVRGNVINRRNHQGPKRARESPVGKLFQGLEICCYGPFTDMLPEQLEWIVELCGASLVKQPHLFAHAKDSTAVIVVQPDAWTEESTCQKLPLQCSIAVVSREWVLDSVACYQCQPLNDYIIPQEPFSMSE